MQYMPNPGQPIPVPQFMPQSLSPYNPPQNPWMTGQVRLPDGSIVPARGSIQGGAANRPMNRGYSSSYQQHGGGYGSYGTVNPNPFQGMGYGGAIGGVNAPLYGGHATSIPIGTVGGYITAPGAQEARYRQAYAQAQAANQNRYNELVGTSIGAPTSVQKGQPMVQVGGKMVPQSQANIEQLNRDVAQRSNFAPALGGHYGRYARGMTGVEAMMDDVGGRYAQRTQQGRQDVNAMDSIRGEYDQRFNRNMGYVSELGEQDTKDINSRYDAQISKATADLAARGLSNSTVLANVAQNINKEREAELARLKDRLLRHKLDTDSQLSGDSLRFSEGQGDRRLRTNAALSGDEAQFWDNARRLGIDVDQRLSGDLLQLIEGVQQPYPDPMIRLRMQGLA